MATPPLTEDQQLEIAFNYSGQVKKMVYLAVNRDGYKGLPYRDDHHFLFENIEQNLDMLINSPFSTAAEKQVFRSARAHFNHCNRFTDFHFSNKNLAPVAPPSGDTNWLEALREVFEADKRSRAGTGQ